MVDDKGTNIEVEPMEGKVYVTISRGNDIGPHYEWSLHLTKKMAVALADELEEAVMALQGLR